MRIDRRKFIQQSSLAGAALFASAVLPNDVFAEKEFDRITILHTNEVHSQLEPFPMDGSKNAGMGGVAGRASVIKQIRAENANVLLLDAGDIFQGTPYFNLYHGEPEIKAMSMMGYDAATMGNHDFDKGIENFATQIKDANFPIIICNYNFSNTAMDNKFIPYKIFQKGNLKIGVLGVGIELKGLVAENLYEKTVYQEPIESANRTAEILRKNNCDMIICLSHIGYKYAEAKVSDEILAKECFDIDLIIGGHTHKFFDSPKVYQNQRGGDTVVNQVGWGGIQLGRLDYSFARSGKKKAFEAHTVVIGKKTRE